jgi:hypothetical protein
LQILEAHELLLRSSCILGVSRYLKEREVLIQTLHLGLKDGGVILDVREWLSGAGANITGYGLSKAIGDYIDSERAKDAVQDAPSPHYGNCKQTRLLVKMQWQTVHL